jgi:hypothetical protein
MLHAEILGKPKLMIFLHSKLVIFGLNSGTEGLYAFRSASVLKA